MSKDRLEAFSDGVIAIIITIMVLEIRVPHDDSWAALKPLISIFLSYVLSFVYIGIYWNNHHHMLQVVHHVDGSVLWANAHLLFWLSLIPFASGWMGENHFTTVPVILYGIILLMNAVAYTILSRRLLRLHAPDSLLAVALGRDGKGKISLALYAIAIPLAFADAHISLALYALVAAIWIIPDRRIESKVENRET